MERFSFSTSHLHPIKLSNTLSYVLTNDYIIDTIDSI